MLPKPTGPGVPLPMDFFSRRRKSPPAKVKVPVADNKILPLKVGNADHPEHGAMLPRHRRSTSTTWPVGVPAEAVVPDNAIVPWIGPDNARPYLPINYVGEAQQHAPLTKVPVEYEFIGEEPDVYEKVSAMFKGSEHDPGLGIRELFQPEGLPIGPEGELPIEENDGGDNFNFNAVGLDFGFFDERLPPIYDKEPNETKALFDDEIGLLFDSDRVQHKALRFDSVAPGKKSPLFDSDTAQQKDTLAPELPRLDSDRVQHKALRFDSVAPGKKSPLFDSDTAQQKDTLAPELPRFDSDTDEQKALATPTPEDGNEEEGNAGPDLLMLLATGGKI